MLNESDMMLIERYLDDEMSAEERSMFIDRVKSELDLEKTLMQQAALLSSLKLHHEGDLRQEIGETLPPIKQGNMVWRYAAAISFLILSGVFAIFYLNNGYDREQLFQTYFTPYPYDPPARNGVETESSIAKNYAIGAYDQILNELVSKGDLNDRNNSHNLVIASAYMGLANWEKATPWIEVCTKSSDRLIENDALWLEAINQLMLDEVDAVMKLNKIAENPGPYRKEAIKLLEEIH